MLINRIICFALFLIFSMNVSSEDTIDKNLYEKPYASNELKSGQYFSRKETRNMEIEEFENPGMIWVERGKELFDIEEGKNSNSCSSCHKQDVNSLLGAAATYPKVHNNKLINLGKKMKNKFIQLLTLLFLFFTTQAYSNPINKIDFIGLNNNAESNFLELIPFKIGQNFSPYASEQIIESLFQTHLLISCYF